MYELCGEVVHGRHVGRQIGFPTANINTSNIPLESAVYFVTAQIIQNNQKSQIYKGIMFIGKSQTFNCKKQTYEVHLVDYNGDDFYGSQLDVKIISEMRKNFKFNSKEELAQQLEKDKKFALEQKI